MSNRKIYIPPVTPPLTAPVNQQDINPPTSTAQTDAELTTTSTTDSDVSEPKLFNKEASKSPLKDATDPLFPDSAVLEHSALQSRNLNANSSQLSAPTTTAVHVNSPLSMTELTKAASAGDADAQFELGKRYYQGVGVQVNHEEAFKYYLMAAEQNHPAGLRGLGEMFELESDESPEKLDMAIKLYHQAADLGDLIAEYNLGVFYQYGTGVEVNKKTSAMYLERAASKDHPSANLNLGLLYQEGVNGVPDYKKAMSYFNRAAELGNPKAEGCIAVLYQHGLGVDKNTEKAIELFTTCAERGLVHAQYNLSIILSEDDSKYKDIETAFYWLEKAANLDFAPAQKNLSIFLWGGKGSAVDFEEAVKWAFIARHNNEDKADDLINYYEKEIPHEAFIEGFERAKSYLADKD
jgi:TPR repeat protein